MKIIRLYETDLLSLTSKQAQVIAHQCNCTTTRNLGLAKAISAKFSYADFYSKRAEPSMPGTIKIAGKKGQRKIVGMFAQYNPGKPNTAATTIARGEWFWECLGYLGRIKNLRSVAFPDHIGCGLGGGVWEHYEKMLEDFAEEHPNIQVLICSLDEKPSTLSDCDAELKKMSQKLKAECFEELARVVLDDDHVAPRKLTREHLWNVVYSTIFCEDPNKNESDKEGDEESADEEGDEESADEEGDEDPDSDKEGDEESADEEGDEDPDSDKEGDEESADEEGDEDPDSDDEETTTSREWEYSDGIVAFVRDELSVELEEDESVWKPFFEDVLKNQTLEVMTEQLEKDAKTTHVYPPIQEVFTAFSMCLEPTVVIIGQDPYHTPGAAMGLAFGHHSDRNQIQPSLRNIYTELENEGYEVNRKQGDLSAWAIQGVFLINTALTVRQGQANSHSRMWEYFTTQLFRYLSKTFDHLVVIMWGKHAQTYSKLFDTEKHSLLSSPHPSPFSAADGFFGSKPFSKANKRLKRWGMNEIDWAIE